MHIVLTIIALQQGMFALGWWLSGSLLGLSRRAALHWSFATLSAALALGLIAQRGRWPDLLSIGLANVLAMGSFLATRRGVQVFLRLPLRDRESALLLAGVLLPLALFVADARHGRAAVLAASALIAWTLLRCAWEARAALRRTGDHVAAGVVFAPLAALGGAYLLRMLLGFWRPALAAQPLGEDNPFNVAVVISFMVVGLVLNMVLAYLVVSRLVKRLQQRAMRDPLTALDNRRALALQLQREMTRLRRHGQCFALLAVDVDHFKRINDNHGHGVGDAVLVQLAQLLRQAAREVDTVARVGGEEFCLLLPASDAAGARHAAERLCRLVRQSAWPQLPPGQGVTVSVGVALAAAGDSSEHMALARADAALMRAKAGGRDQVVEAGCVG